MPLRDIQQKNDHELSAYVQEQKEALRQERFSSAGSKGRNVKKAREVRKDVARAMTLLKIRRAAK